MEKPWTEIMSKQEMVEYLRGYLKQRGYKKQKQKSIFVFCKPRFSFFPKFHKMF